MAQPYDFPLEQLKEYRPALTKQSDFEQFWQQSLSQLEKIPLQYETKDVEYPVRGVQLKELTYLSYHQAAIGGWLALPEGEGPFPGLVFFHGYNWAADGNIHDTVNWALHGYAVLHMFVRGQQGHSINNQLSSHGHPAGWMTQGIQDPHEYYYRGVYLDAVRAVEILASLEMVDEAKIGLIGGSQGGALSLASAALSSLPKVVVADYPYLSHFERAIDITPTGPYLEINEYFRRNSDPHIEEKAKTTLSYFDVMNLAPQIKAHTWISVGLVDQITPPSTIFAAFNHLNCSKEMAVFRYHGHEYIPGAVIPKLRTLKQYLS